MNILLLLSFLFFQDPPSIYDLSVESINGENISMSDFKGKRIVVVSLDGQSPSSEKIAFLDSLSTEIRDIQVIVIPSLEQGKTVQENTIKDFTKATKSSLIIARPGKLSKQTKEEQQTLFQWLTKVENNLHFNTDGEAEQYFVISAEGTLYAVGHAGTPNRALLDFLEIRFDESQHLIYNSETKLYEPRKK